MRTSIAPTAVKEDYLRAVFKLGEDSKEPVKLVAVASYLGLSRSTVSERVRELVEQGYLAHSHYGQISFTKTGKRLARNLTHKHRMIEVFLCDTLGLSKKQAHTEAHRLEHALSDTVIKRIGRFLGNPNIDPHGSPIPALG